MERRIPVRTVVVGAPSGLGANVAEALDVDALDFGESLPPDLHGVVIVVGGEPSPVPMELRHTPEAVWTGTAEHILRMTMRTLQESHDVLRTDGRVVVITPTIGMVGCANLVPYTTAIEGVRAMAKSAARQWGAEAISVNLLAVPLHVLRPDLAQLASHLTPPALGAKAAVVPAVVAAVQFLLGPPGAGVTGATIVADGGSVMAP